MLGLLFLKVLTAWKTSTTLCLLAISHTMLLAHNTPLRPPPFLSHTCIVQNSQWVEGRKVKGTIYCCFISSLLALTCWLWTNDHFLSVCFVSYNWGRVKI